MRFLSLLSLLLFFCFQPAFATIIGIPESEIPELKKKAEAGCVEAQEVLDRLKNKQSVDTEKSEAAPIDLQLLTAEAESGDIKAQYKLGKYYQDRLDFGAYNPTDIIITRENGEVAKKSVSASELEEGKQLYINAIKWYTKAAEQGYSPVYYQLGIMYDTAHETRPKYVGDISSDEANVKAIMWFKKAAETGNRDALYALGYNYYNGVKGIPQDYAEAYFWLSLYINPCEMDKSVFAWRDDAEKHLTSKQKSAADKRISEWKPTSGAKQ